MARMTENTNLQRALLRRIDEVGKGVVTIKEGGRVSEMQLAEGGRWVGLRMGENDWVRGSVVVSFGLLSLSRSMVRSWPAGWNSTWLFRDQSISYMGSQATQLLHLDRCTPTAAPRPELTVGRSRRAQLTCSSFLRNTIPGTWL